MAGPNIPVTVESVFTYPEVAAVIGDQYYTPQTAVNNGYWYLIVDLTTLQVLLNQVTTDSSSLPQGVAPYVGNPQYLFILSTVALNTDNVPQGNFFAFLLEIGAGVQLQRVEQINEQLGTGTFGTVCYVLATTMGLNADAGFEESSFTASTILTFQLMPVMVDGQTIYAPIELGA